MIAGVEDDHAALLHEGIDLGECRVGERARILPHRPIQQREEGELVLVDIDAHRLAGLERGAGGEHLAQSRQAPRGSVDLRVAGHDVSELGLERGLKRKIVGALASSRRSCPRGAGGVLLTIVLWPSPLGGNRAE